MYSKFYYTIPLYFRELQLLGIAVSCLQIFIQNNWLGPVNSGDTFDWLSPIIKERRKVDYMLINPTIYQ